MPGISICNSAGRDAVVNAESVRPRMHVRWLDEQGRQVSTVRVLKSTLDHDLPRLLSAAGSLNEVAEALVEHDPEIDREQTGRFLQNTSRVYVDSSGKVAYRAQFNEVITNPDGSVRERRPRKLTVANVSADLPLRWTNVFIKKSEACRRFVFSRKVQLQHINGLTYDFLFAIAKDLEQRESLMVLGAGPKSNEPFILRRGGVPYRGFLEGRTDGQRYRLVLHFSNLELRPPVEPAPAEEAEA